MRPISRDSGYVLFAMCIAVVILGIMLTAAVPVWKTVVQREKEEELIWRANQYLQAIDRYQRKYPGAYPTSFEQLRDQKFIRKLYKDPMTEDGEWLIRRQLSPNDPAAFPGVPPGGGAQGPGGAQPPGGRGMPTQPGGQGPGQQTGQDPSGGGLPGGGSRFQNRNRSGFGSGGGFGAAEGIGGIIGVQSKSKEKSIRIYNGKERYNEWVFVYAPQNQGLPGQTPPGVAPGQAPPGTRPPPGGPSRNPSTNPSTNPFSRTPGSNPRRP